VGAADKQGAVALPKLGRRRRRLLWTASLLVLAAIVGITLLSMPGNGETAAYVPGEDSDAITRRLDRGIPEAAPTPVFVDVTDSAGLGDFRTFEGARTSQLPEDMGAGAAWADVDGDGDEDLFVVSVGGPLGADPASRARSRLYRNTGGGTFDEDRTFPETRIVGMGAAFGDFDGDGDLDLVVTGWNSLQLYRNDDGSFVGDPALPNLPGFWSGGAWSDFDRDGDLDLYVCGYVQYIEDTGTKRRATPMYGRAVPYTLNPASFEPERNLLFRNDGNGFTEIAVKLEVDNTEGRSLGALWHDFNGDGWPDLYVANDISDNAFYVNREGRFENVSHEAWVADYRGAMGLAAGDWDRDGDDDLFVTHWVAQENALDDSLLNNLEEGGLRFVDVADRQGLGHVALRRVGWGAEFTDLDADGWLDLVVANGSTLENDAQPRGLKPEPAFLFWNNRGDGFHDLAPLLPELDEPHVSRGLATADYDGDGDIDLLFVDHDGGVRLLENRIPQANWIALRLQPAQTQGKRSRPVDGALVEVEVGGVVHRRTLSSVSYLSQSSRTLHVGLGDATQAARVVVSWPDGSIDRHVGLAGNRTWELSPGSTSPVAVAPRGGTDTHVASGGEPMDERQRVTAFWRAQRAAMDKMKIERDWQAAIPLFREALALDPRHEDSLYYLGNCLVEIGKTDEALERFAELMRLNEMSHRAYKRWGTLTAIMATSSDELAAAARALERATEINPEETGARQALGEVALLRGDLDGARLYLGQVARSDPDARSALFLLAYLDWRQGDPASAATLLSRAETVGEAEKLPEGAVGEGEVKRVAHRDETPLLEFVERWNGSLDAAEAFRPLERKLTDVMSQEIGDAHSG
jgi:tetratricopeptide (TPR) repeat protein